MIALVALLFACAPKAPPVATAIAEPTLPPGRDLFQRHLDAIGGEKNLRAHQSTAMEGTFALPMQGITGPLEILQGAPDLYYSSVTIPNLGKVEEGHYAGGLGWQKDPMSGPALKEGEEAADLELRARYYGDAEFDTMYTAIETVGRAVWAGEPCWQVDATLTTGRKQTHYFSEATGLKVGMTFQFPTPMGDMPANLELHDYVDDGGLKTPRRWIDRKGPIETILEMKTVVFDAPDFALPPLPADVQALVDAEGSTRAP
jgi:hypothetical protein